jgi:hypothetical protein
MTFLWSFLASAIGPLAIRALLALGFTGISFAGVNTAFQALITYSQSQWLGLPTAVLQLASVAGVPIALGMIFGAGTARITLWVTTNMTKLIFKGTGGAFKNV